MVLDQLHFHPSGASFVIHISSVGSESREFESRPGSLIPGNEISMLDSRNCSKLLNTYILDPKVLSKYHKNGKKPCHFGVFQSFVALFFHSVSRYRGIVNDLISVS